MNGGHFKTKYWVGQKVQVFHKMLQKNPNKLFGQLTMKHSLWPRVISPPNSSEASLLIPPLPPQNAVPITTSLSLL